MEDAQIDAMVYQLNMTVFGLMRSISVAMTDDPKTEADESQFTASEAALAAAQAMPMALSIVAMARGMSGQDWARLVTTWANKAGIVM